MRPPLTALLLLGLTVTARAVPDATHSPQSIEEDVDSPKESEADDLGIIPKSEDVNSSTATITPVSIYVPKKPLDQGTAELEQATALAKAGDAEAASDLSLQAYDDLCQIHVRRPRQKRAKLHTLRYQAATLYMQSSTTAIKNYVRAHDMSLTAFEEGKARLGDLKDVAHDYPDLLRNLNRMLEQYPASLQLAADQLKN